VKGGVKSPLWQALHGLMPKAVPGCYPTDAFLKRLKKIKEREMQEKPNRFDYVKYDQFAQEKQVSFKEKFSFLAKMVEEDLSNGRAKALVLTKLEESYMWVGKAIRDEQIEQGRDAPLLEERGKE
jgi:hypothetical protein